MTAIKSLIILALGFTLITCEKEVPVPHVGPQKDELLTVVDFDFRIEGNCTTPTLEVILENKSPDADFYFWDFGDGTTSLETNPRKVYATYGTYTIKLTAFFKGIGKQLEKKVWIIRNSDGNGPTLQFSYTQISATSSEILFEITTDGNPSLDFGDGGAPVRGVKIIKHMYAGPGRYLVFATAQNDRGCSCASGTVVIGF